MSAQAKQKDLFAQDSDSSFSYDSMPYESFSYPFTHPDHLYTIGKLFKLKPADFKKCRVLELGCAGGGNLLPLAYSFPESEYIGIDLSKEQIHEADQHKKTLGLKNVTFRQLDIMQAGADLGTFDYIICHGVFSWVPQAVSKKILELCRDRLNANGMAVISYNTLPGWNFVNSLREMMQYHSQRFSDPSEKVRQARAFLNFLSDSASGANQAYKAIIDNERRILSNTNDSYLFHDHLEDENHQYYFHEFAAMAKEAGLDYVGDVHLSTMYAGNLPKEAAEKLGALNDIIRQEQYIDFVSNRRFRHSIITKAGTPVNRALDPAMIYDFYLSSNMMPELPAGEKDVTFRRRNGPGNFVTHTKEATLLFMEIANAFPQRVKMKDVIKAAAKKLGGEKKETEALLQASALELGIKLVIAGFLELHCHEGEFENSLSKKPRAFPVAQIQAMQPNCRFVTNAQRVMINIDTFGAYLTRYLDGKNDQPALVARLVEHALRGDIAIRQNNVPVTEPGQLAVIVEKLVVNALGKIRENGILVA